MTKKELETACHNLQCLQRERAYHLKSRNKILNRLLATIASRHGYHSGMKESERKAAFKEADDLIKKVVGGRIHTEDEAIIKASVQAMDPFELRKQVLEDQMATICKSLPVAAWVDHKNQRGFGIHLLGVLIGETGNLANYPNPAKVWRRMGCAPFEKDGEVHMGSSWRKRDGKKGVKLTADDWSEFGYSPRRRSIAYVIGENFVKQNCKRIKGTDEWEWIGPYRRRYDEAKVRFKQLHEDATPGHCHAHGMLLASKLLIKNLWIEWNPRLVKKMKW